MSEMAPEAPPRHENVLTRKIGPLPTWGWVAIIAGLIVGYEFVRGRSSSASSTSGSGSSTVPEFVNQTYVSPGPPSAPHPQGREHSVSGSGTLGPGPGKDGGGGTGPPTTQGGRTQREVATGSESLNAIAKARGTTVANIIAVTKASHLDAGNLKAFLTAAAHPARKLPKGTVYYVSS